MFDTKGEAGTDRPPVMAAFGGGLDSTAMLAVLCSRGLMPDAVLFADTGAEKPETYLHIFLMDDWLHARGIRCPGDSVWRRPPGYEDMGLPESRTMAAINVVRNDGMYGTLERNCLEKKMLPSITYGFRGCSEKYKQRPQHKWAKQWPAAASWWGLSPAGRRDHKGPRAANRVVKLIGYSADEDHRSKVSDDDFYHYVYPLREAGIGRAAAAQLLRDTGLPVPGKSSCFYCSAMKKPEIVSLIQLHPRLMDRALEMEANAELKTVKGLGRYFSWAEYTKEIERDGPPAPKEKPEKWALAPGQHVTCTCEGQVREGEYIDSDDYVEEEGSLPTE